MGSVEVGTSWTIVSMADRSRQLWLIFLGYHVLGYSTAAECQVMGSFGTHGS